MPSRTSLLLTPLLHGFTNELLKTAMFGFGGKPKLPRAAVSIDPAAQAFMDRAKQLHADPSFMARVKARRSIITPRRQAFIQKLLADIR